MAASTPSAPGTQTASVHHDNLAHWQQAGPLELGLSVLPFVVLLLMIAVFPLLPKIGPWWHHNRNKLMLSGLCGVLGVGMYLFATGDWHTVLHTFVEFLAFIALLASLFVISGGIYVSGPIAGFPHFNTLILALGAVLANLMGTTGASMLLIRPLLTANQARRHKTHLMIFFIFIVANCGGLLTPLGDPPLYLGFLKGVPFSWTLRLWPQWVMMLGALLFAFLMLDSWYYVREELETHEELTQTIQARANGERYSFEGWHNLGFLGAVIAVILGSATVLQPWLTGLSDASSATLYTQLIQALAMGGVAFASYRFTRPAIREANHFSFGAINEVACLFIGIFGAMIPALKILEARGSALALHEPWQYFWATGLLSGVLDNAPTYLTFVTLGASQSGLSSDQLALFAQQQPELLGAISTGAVFMGALTYIGNGPNFMVKAMAEQAGVRMPGFGGYLLWSMGILLPLLVLVSLLFYR